MYRKPQVRVLCRVRPGLAVPAPPSLPQPPSTPASPHAATTAANALDTTTTSSRSSSVVATTTASSAAGNNNNNNAAAARAAMPCLIYDEQTIEVFERGESVASWSAAQSSSSSSNNNTATSSLTTTTTTMSMGSGGGGGNNGASFGRRSHSNDARGRLTRLQQSVARDTARRFVLDEVLGESATQEQVFVRVGKPVVRNVLLGYNGTVLSYGQTGSGKTHTMLGPRGGNANVYDDTSSADYAQRGLVPRIFEDLFATLSSLSPAERTWSVHISAFEVYKEEIFDLLAGATTASNGGRGALPCSGTTSQHTSVPRARSASSSSRNNGNTSSGLTSTCTSTHASPARARPAEYRIREDVVGGRGVYIESLECLPVFCVADALRLVRLAMHRRRTAATAANASSSRSHSLICVYIEQIDYTAAHNNNNNNNKGGSATSMLTTTTTATLTTVEGLLGGSNSTAALTAAAAAADAAPPYAAMTAVGGGGVRIQSRLNLVDLAGSEKVSKTHADGARLAEARTINLSLTLLGNVIHKLTDGKSGYVPYRDSKLTRILQDSLGGNSLTTLICHCSPAMASREETLSTLRFAARAKRVRNRPRVNRELSAKELNVQLLAAQHRIDALEEKLQLKNELYEAAMQQLHETREQLQQQQQQQQQHPRATASPSPLLLLHHPPPAPPPLPGRQRDTHSVGVHVAAAQSDKGAECSLSSVGTSSVGCSGHGTDDGVTTAITGSHDDDDGDGDDGENDEGDENDDGDEAEDDTDGGEHNNSSNSSSSRRRRRRGSNSSAYKARRGGKPRKSHTAAIVCNNSAHRTLDTLVASLMKELDELREELQLRDEELLQQRERVAYYRAESDTHAAQLRAAVEKQRRDEELLTAAVQGAHDEKHALEVQLEELRAAWQEELCMRNSSRSNMSSACDVMTAATMTTSVAAVRAADVASQQQQQCHSSDNNKSSSSSSSNDDDNKDGGMPSEHNDTRHDVTHDTAPLVETLYDDGRNNNNDCSSHTQHDDSTVTGSAAALLRHAHDVTLPYTHGTDVAVQADETEQQQQQLHARSRVMDCAQQTRLSCLRHRRRQGRGGGAADAQQHEGGDAHTAIDDASVTTAHDGDNNSSNNSNNNNNSNDSDDSDDDDSDDDDFAQYIRGKRTLHRQQQQQQEAALLLRVMCDACTMTDEATAQHKDDNDNKDDDVDADVQHALSPTAHVLVANTRIYSSSSSHTTSPRNNNATTTSPTTTTTAPDYAQHRDSDNATSVRSLRSDEIDSALYVARALLQQLAQSTSVTHSRHRHPPSSPLSVVVVHDDNDDGDGVVQNSNNNTSPAAAAPLSSSSVHEAVYALEQMLYAIASALQLASDSDADSVVVTHSQSPPLQQQQQQQSCAFAWSTLPCAYVRDGEDATRSGVVTLSQQQRQQQQQPSVSLSSSSSSSRQLCEQLCTILHLAIGVLRTWRLHGMAALQPSSVTSSSAVTTAAVVHVTDRDDDGALPSSLTCTTQTTTGATTTVWQQQQQRQQRRRPSSLSQSSSVLTSALHALASCVAALRTVDDAVVRRTNAVVATHLDTSQLAYVLHALQQQQQQQQQQWQCCASSSSDGGGSATALPLLPWHNNSSVIVDGIDCSSHRRCQGGCPHDVLPLPLPPSASPWLRITDTTHDKGYRSAAAAATASSSFASPVCAVRRVIRRSTQQQHDGDDSGTADVDGDKENRRDDVANEEEDKTEQQQQQQRLLSRVRAPSLHAHDDNNARLEQQQQQQREEAKDDDDVCAALRNGNASSSSSSSSSSLLHTQTRVTPVLAVLSAVALRSDVAESLVCGRAGAALAAVVLQHAATQPPMQPSHAHVAHIRARVMNASAARACRGGGSGGDTDKKRGRGRVTAAAAEQHSGTNDDDDDDGDAYDDDNDCCCSCHRHCRNGDGRTCAAAAAVRRDGSLCSYSSSSSSKSSSVTDTATTTTTTTRRATTSSAGQTQEQHVAYATHTQRCVQQWRDAHAHLTRIAHPRVQTMAQSTSAVRATHTSYMSTTTGAADAAAASVDVDEDDDEQQQQQQQKQRCSDKAVWTSTMAMLCDAAAQTERRACVDCGNDVHVSGNDSDEASDAHDTAATSPVTRCDAQLQTSCTHAHDSAVTTDAIVCTDACVGHDGSDDATAAAAAQREEEQTRRVAEATRRAAAAEKQLVYHRAALANMLRTLTDMPLAEAERHVARNAAGCARRVRAQVAYLRRAEQPALRRALAQRGRVLASAHDALCAMLTLMQQTSSPALATHDGDGNATRAAATKLTGESDAHDNNDDEDDKGHRRRCTAASVAYTKQGSNDNNNSNSNNSNDDGSDTSPSSLPIESLNVSSLQPVPAAATTLTTTRPPPLLLLQHHHHGDGGDDAPPLPFTATTASAAEQQSQQSPRTSLSLSSSNSVASSSSSSSLVVRRNGSMPQMLRERVRNAQEHQEQQQGANTSSHRCDKDDNATQQMCVRPVTATTTTTAAGDGDSSGGSSSDKSSGVEAVAQRMARAASATNTQHDVHLQPYTHVLPLLRTTTTTTTAAAVAAEDKKSATTTASVGAASVRSDAALLRLQGSLAQLTTYVDKATLRQYRRGFAALHLLALHSSSSSSGSGSGSSSHGGGGGGGGNSDDGNAASSVRASGSCAATHARRTHASSSSSSGAAGGGEQRIINVFDSHNSARNDESSSDDGDADDSDDEDDVRLSTAATTMLLQTRRVGGDDGHRRLRSGTDDEGDDDVANEADAAAAAAAHTRTTTTTTALTMTTATPTSREHEAKAREVPTVACQTLQQLLVWLCRYTQHTAQLQQQRTAAVQRAAQLERVVVVQLQRERDDSKQELDALRLLMAVLQRENKDMHRVLRHLDIDLKTYMESLEREERRNAALRQEANVLKSMAARLRTTAQQHEFCEMATVELAMKQQDVSEMESEEARTRTFRDADLVARKKAHLLKGAQALHRFCTHLSTMLQCRQPFNTGTLESRRLNLLQDTAELLTRVEEQRVRLTS